MARRSTAGLIPLIGAMLLVGCAAGSTAQLSGPTAAQTSAAPPTVSPSPESPLPTVTAMPTTGQTPTSATTSGATARPTVTSDEARSIDLAKQDLAKRENVAADQITVVSVSPVQWPTSALGCPQPGVMYSQVVTPGYQIVLEANGLTYEYHSDRGRRAVYCAKP